MNAEVVKIGDTLDYSLFIDNHVTFKAAMVPVGSFHFRQENVSATLNIQSDITPLESVNLCVLLVQAAAAFTSASAFGWVDYIRDKNLIRHFVMKDYR